MKTMMSDLPQDLVEEILSRVPAAVLKQLQHTCKRWNALFKDRGFTQKHQRKAPKQPHHLMLKGFMVCPMNVEIDLSVAAPSIGFKDALDLKNFHSKQVDIAKVFHCEGLLLCTTENKNLVVWNPCSGETKWIKARTGYKKGSMFALGYQNNKSCRSYKILSCWDHRNEFEFEMYDFSSGSWRVLDDMDPDYYIHRSCVSLKGNTYWVASDRQDNDNSAFLLSFDFTRERFRRLNLPPVSTPGVVLSLVREEQLSALRPNFLESKMDLWVTNNKFDTETALLWSKSFTVDFLVPGGSRPFLVTFLLDEEKKVAVCCRAKTWYSDRVYVIGEDYYTDIPLVNSRKNNSRVPFIFNYVPSLAQIQQGEETKEENETSRKN